MAKNTKILTNIAFKKLSNASISNPGFSEFQESISTNIQLGTNTIFGETPPTTPPTTLYDVDTNNIVQKVEFDLIPLEDSIYNANSYSGDSSDYDDINSGATPTTHSFAIAFPSDYETVGNSNPKAGTGFFTNGTQLSNTNGEVQLIPLSYGSNYTPVIKDNNNNSINIATNAQDFYIDYYSGVVFRQDGDDSTVPTKIQAWIYIGEYASDVIENVVNSSIFNQTGSFYSTTNNIQITGSLNVTNGITGSISADNIEGLNLSQIATGSVTGSVDVNNVSFLLESGSTELFKVDKNGLTTTQDLEVEGDLTVQGTASFVNSENLNIVDKFILINSGSSTLSDSGIVSQYNTAGSGSAFVLESGNGTDHGDYGRWAVSYDVNGTDNSIEADEYVVTTKLDTNNDPTSSPTWGGSNNGKGNMWINESTGDIFIYS